MKHPCYNCISMIMCTQKIRIKLEEYNEDITFTDPEKCEGNPDEWMEELIECELADFCAIIKSYLNDKDDLVEFICSRNIHKHETELIKQATKELYDRKLEDLMIFFGKKVGIDFYQWDGWNTTKEGFRTALVAHKSGYDLVLDRYYEKDRS